MGVINDIGQVHRDPQVRARDLVFDLPHPVSGSVPQVRNPMRFSESPVIYRNAAPTLGADTQAVLQEVLDYSDVQVNAVTDNA